MNPFYVDICAFIGCYSAAVQRFGWRWSGLYTRALVIEPWHSSRWSL